MYKGEEQNINMTGYPVVLSTQMDLVSHWVQQWDVHVVYNEFNFNAPMNLGFIILQVDPLFSFIL